MADKTRFLLEKYKRQKPFLNNNYFAAQIESANHFQAKKTPQSAAFEKMMRNDGLFAYFSPCIAQTHGAVKHQFVSCCVAAVEAEIPFTLELERFTSNSGL